MGHARAVLAIEGAGAQLEAARRILNDSLTVRDVENLVKAGRDSNEDTDKAKPAPEGTAPDDPNVAHALERLRYRLGTPVRLKAAGEGRGRVEIDYFGDGDLARLFDMLLGEDAGSAAGG
jgi:ParB family chromosome partitioning protein